LSTSATISIRTRSVFAQAHAASWRPAAGATPAPVAELRTQ
jgi:hypothetical protein